MRLKNGLFETSPWRSICLMRGHLCGQIAIALLLLNDGIRNLTLLSAGGCYLATYCLLLLYHSHHIY